MSGAGTRVAALLADAAALKAVAEPTDLQALADRLQLAPPRLWHELMQRCVVRAERRARRRR